MSEKINTLADAATELQTSCAPRERVRDVRRGAGTWRDETGGLTGAGEMEMG